MSQIVLFQSPNGQEIIGKIHSDSETEYVLEYPLAVRVVPQENSEEYGIKLVPFSPSIPDGKWTFVKNQIVAITHTIPDGLSKYYLQLTSGIEIVSALSDFEKLGK